MKGKNKMDKKNRLFFNALNTFDKTIDINHITVEQIVELYRRYEKWYEEFMKKQKGEERIKQDKHIKSEFDEMYLFWINPFNIAIRNAIGKTGVKKIEVEKSENEESVLSLTQETYKNYQISIFDGKTTMIKTISGQIDVKRFNSDKEYRRIILEAIENMEIENHRNKTNNNNIGTIKEATKNGKKIWEQEIR